MESQDKEREYKHNVWEVYRKEWETGNREKRLELNQRMLRWQELMQSGLTANQAYIRVMGEDSDYRVIEEPSERRLITSVSPQMRKASLIFLSLALVAAIVYGIIITGDRNALNTRLESAQNALATTQTMLSSTREKLTSTQSELSLKNQELDLTKANLNFWKQTFESTQAELGTTKQTLVSVQNKLDTTKAELETAEDKVELYMETFGAEVFSNEQPLIRKAGLGFSREYVELYNDSGAMNPTWSQLKAFLHIDSTDDYDYNALNFNCTNFAEMLHNRAEKKGIKAAFVAVLFEGEEDGHALNAFKTTDKGLVYVDCTGGDIVERLKDRLYGYAVEYDTIAYVVKGKEYGRVSIDMASSPDYSYYAQIGKALNSWYPLGIVKSIEIYW